MDLGLKEKKNDFLEPVCFLIKSVSHLIDDLG